jgi:predicted enzyme related to lactoylglutathione lyase
VLAYPRYMPVHHTVDYFEIPVLEMAGAKAFYNAAFGWSFVESGPGYADIQGAGLAGGLRLVSTPPPQMCGGPLVVLYSDDLAASERAVTAAGATITERLEFPGGKRFHFVDPTGCELAIWTKVDGDAPR